MNNFEKRIEDFNTLIEAEQFINGLISDSSKILVEYPTRLGLCRNPNAGDVRGINGDNFESFVKNFKRKFERINVNDRYAQAGSHLPIDPLAPKTVWRMIFYSKPQFTTEILEFPAKTLVDIKNIFKILDKSIISTFGNIVITGDNKDNKDNKDFTIKYPNDLNDFLYENIKCTLGDGQYIIKIPVKKQIFVPKSSNSSIGPAL